MIICQICNLHFKNINGLAKHIHNQHDISKQEYYNQYINKISLICICGNLKKFRNLGEGYRQYCSNKCRSNNIEPTAYWKNKKQPQSLIDSRRNTMFKKYGVSNGYLINHTVAKPYKGFICRSSYEKAFIDFAEKYNYTLKVPNRIAYEHEGRSRYFYPDFYIEELDLIVEIKSDWTWKLQLDLNISKMVCTINQEYDIIFIDEEDGILDLSKWDELNLYLIENSNNYWEKEN